MRAVRTDLLRAPLRFLAADDMQCVDLGGRRIIKKIFFFQAEDGILDQPRSRGLGDVYKRQILYMIKFIFK